MSTEYIDVDPVEAEPSADEFTAACTDCDWSFTSKSSQGLANAQLSRHRHSKHGVEPKARSKSPRQRTERTPTPIGALRTAAAEIPKGKKAPTESELTNALTRFVGTISVLGASYAAETDPTITTEEDRDAVVDYLSLSPEDSRDVAYPFAKLLGKSRLNRAYGRAFVDNIDVASAGAALVNLGIKWRRYRRERDRRLAQGIGVAPPVPRSGPEMNGNVASPQVPHIIYPPPGTGEPATGFAGPPSMQGHVVSADEVRRMRGG